MNSRFLPRYIDNQYRGHRLALWFFWVVIIMRALQGLSIIIAGPAIVRDADGIPIETFPTGASQSIVALFVLSGFSRLVFSLLGVFTFIWYRSAVTFVFAVLALDQLGKEMLLYVYPLLRVGNPMGPKVNLGLLVLTLFGLALSITGKRNKKTVI